MIENMDKSVIKQVVLEQESYTKDAIIGVEREQLAFISSLIPLPHIVIISGMRRCGKSTLMRQILRKHYEQGFYFVDFEDERFVRFNSDDFNPLYEVLIELYGPKEVFFFDEIQNIDGWELFARRLHRDKNKLFITGSNASLLSSELSTHLTGRHVVVELLPFSFREYLRYHQVDYHEKSLWTTREKAMISKYFNEFTEYGGLPEYLEHKNPLILQNVYDNILYKDVIVRYDVKESKALRELSLNLMSNLGTPLSYAKLKNNLHLGSVNTVKNYIHYLESAYLIFTLDRFSYSVSQQTTMQKKVYSIDTGLARHIAFYFSKNLGRYLENIVYLELRRRYKDLFYYRTDSDLEVDFLVREGAQVVLLIQVTESLADAKTREREYRALLQAMEELHVDKGLILTRDEEKADSKHPDIEVVPIYKWLLL
jgi:predicted AAA+ superfamily ATPase